MEEHGVGTPEERMITEVVELHQFFQDWFNGLAAVMTAAPVPAAMKPAAPVSAAMKPAAPVPAAVKPAAPVPGCFRTPIRVFPI